MGFLGINWTKAANTVADFTPVGWVSRIANGKGAYTNAKNLVTGAVNGMEGQTNAHVDAAQIGEYDPNAEAQAARDYAAWQAQDQWQRTQYAADHPDDPTFKNYKNPTPPPAGYYVDPGGKRLYDDRTAQLRLGNDLGTGYKDARLGLNADYQPYLDQLKGAANGTAPSQAQDMLRSGTARAQAGAYATAASAPVNGATAAAMMSQAGGQAAGLEQQGARDAGQLRAQEISDARTQYGSALGAKYGAESGLLSGEGSAVGSTLSNVAGQDLTREQTNVGAINDANAANAGIQQKNDENKGQFYRDVVKTVGTAAAASDIRGKDDIQPMDSGGNGKASFLRHLLFGKTAAMGPTKGEASAIKSTIYPAIHGPSTPGAVSSTVAAPTLAVAPTAPVAPNYAAPLPAALSQPGAAASFGGVHTVAPVGMDDGGSFDDQTEYSQSLFSDEHSKEKIRSLEGQLEEARLGLATQIRDTNADYPMATDRDVGTGEYMPGQLHLNAGLAPQVPHGAPRPFAPGEYVRNPDGSWSSEVTMTVQDPRFNGGRATNIPSMWLRNGKPYLAKDEGEAIRYARESGLPFRGYDNIDAANQASIDRESAWQPLKRPEDARRIEPLWDPTGKAARVQATPLVFSGENGGNFRTPDEQLQYVDSVKRRAQPTPLFFDEDNGGTFRTPVEQARYTEDIRDPSVARLGLGGDTREALSTVQPYQYRYKPETAARIGEDTEPRIGIMAQDLERSPNPGVRNVVINTPYGKAIDSRRGLSLALAGTAGLDKRVAAIEDALGKPTKLPRVEAPR